jgi:hypothetical protein
VGVVPPKRLKYEPALAAAKLQLDENSIAGAKAPYFYSVSSARLKSCPVTKPFRTRVFRNFQNKRFSQIDELLPAMIQMRLPCPDRTPSK